MSQEKISVTEIGMPTEFSKKSDSTEQNNYLINSIQLFLHDLKKNIKIAQQTILKYGLQEEKLVYQAKNKKQINNSLRSITTHIEALSKCKLSLERMDSKSEYILLLEKIVCLQFFSVQNIPFNKFGDLAIYNDKQVDLFNQDRNSNFSFSVEVFLVLEALNILIESITTSQNESLTTLAEKFNAIENPSAEESSIDLITKIREQIPNTDPKHHLPNKEELAEKISENINQKSNIKLNRILYASLRFFRMIDHIPKGERKDFSYKLFHK